MTADEVIRRLDQLAGCSERPGEITRLFLTPAHAQALAMVRGWMEQAGLHTSVDAAGTLVGRAGAPDAPVLLLGSHIDSVRNAGRYDGCLGVAIAVALAERLRFRTLPYALEIRAFGDEEGVRFPVTLTGSRVAAGTYDPAWLAMEDGQGITLAGALRGFGLAPDAGGFAAAKAVGAFAYLEVHIEQGPVLEAADAAVGIVTAINGANRYAAIVTGRAGHAGTVPMQRRQDALVAAAEMVLAVRRAACSHDGVVATVGQLAVSPGAANVIPGRCVFTIDLRAPADTQLAAAARTMLAALRQVADANGVALEVTRTHAVGAVACDARLQARLAAAAAACGLVSPSLHSGAGHDAAAMAALCPVGMLFVRCAGGISHHPDEHVSTADVAAALDVMEHALMALNPTGFGEG